MGRDILEIISERIVRRSRDGALPLECPTTSHTLITFTFKLAVFARVPGTYYLFTTAHFYRNTPLSSHSRGKSRVCRLDKIRKEGEGEL